MEWWRIAMIVVGGVLLVLSVVYEQASKSGLGLWGFLTRKRAKPVDEPAGPELPSPGVDVEPARITDAQALALIAQLSGVLSQFGVEPERRQAMLQPIMNVLMFSSGVKK